MKSIGILVAAATILCVVWLAWRETDDLDATVAMPVSVEGLALELIDAVEAHVENRMGAPVEIEIRDSTGFRRSTARIAEEPLLVRFRPAQYVFHLRIEGKGTKSVTRNVTARTQRILLEP
ncbi:MAG: hypothetical protein GY711_20415 [bacterium]|nr:hypothetical protein [bacterium]